MDPFASIATPISGPPPPAPGAGADPFASIAKAPASSTPPPAGLASNAKGEGVYPMVDGQGQTVNIPYSNVQTAAQQGHRFQTKAALQQYARDHAADPLSEDDVEKYIDNLAWYNPVKLGRDALTGIGAGAMKTVTGLDRAPQGHGAGGKIEQDMQLAAATPTHGIVAGAGEGAENVGEWFSGEELLGLLGKSAQAMGLGEKLKSANTLAQVIEKNPLVGKLIKIGSGAVKQATIGGAQTYAKTGDAEAAAKTAALTGVASPVIEAAAQGLSARMRALVSGAASGKVGAEEYAAQARAAIEDHLHEIEDAIGRPRASASAAAVPAPAAATAPGSEMVRAGESPTGIAPRTAIEPARGVTPGSEIGAAAPATAAAGAASATAAKAASSFNVNDVLNTVHDFNGAKDRLQSVAAPMYDALDVATKGKFRTLNAEVTAAQKAAYRAVAGTPEKEALEAAYNNKLGQMSDLIDSTKGLVTPEIVGAAKSAFRQSFLLDDFATIWDRNLEGVPGNTKVSAGQRGVNGRGLMRDLTSAVNKKGRPLIERTLGPGRLDNLEAIARANDTAAKRVAFGEAVRNVARNMAHGAVIGGLGSEVMGAGYKTGATVGAGAIAATYAPQVMKAISANPRIGGYLVSAIEMGARPEAYGPMISRMIQQDQQRAKQEQTENSNGNQ